MEEKTFELLTRMYKEFTDFKSDMMNFRMETNTRLEKVEGHVTRIEFEHGQKLDALFDGYKQQHGKHVEHDIRFDRIEAKLDNLSLKVSSHDSKLEVLEGGRKK